MSSEGTYIHSSTVGGQFDIYKSTIMSQRIPYTNSNLYCLGRLKAPNCHFSLVKGGHLLMGSTVASCCRLFLVRKMRSNTGQITR